MKNKRRKVGRIEKRRENGKGRLIFSWLLRSTKGVGIVFFDRLGKEEIRKM
jgi:hypothetical protein